MKKIVAGLGLAIVLAGCGGYTGTYTHTGDKDCIAIKAKAQQEAPAGLYCRQP